MNLHDIDTQIRQLLEDGIDHDTGEVYTPERLETMLTELGMDREDKILNCCRYMHEHAVMAAVIKEQEQRLALRRKQHEKKAEFLKQWVEQSCQVGEVFEAADIKVSFKKSTRLEIRDAKIIPFALFNTPDPVPIIECPLDKTAAKKWIMEHNGEPPPGVDVIERLNLQIK